MQNLDKKYFETLVKDTYSMIFNLGLRLFNYNAQEAEDFTQEVYLQFFENYHKFDGKSKITTWLYSLALNLGLNKIRKNKKIKLSNLDNIQEKDFSTFENPEDNYQQKVNEDKIKKTVLENLLQLQEEYRIPLILFYYEKLSYKQISEILKIPEGTIKSLIFRGKLILRSKIKDLKNL